MIWLDNGKKVQKFITLSSDREFGLGKFINLTYIRTQQAPGDPQLRLCLALVSPVHPVELLRFLGKVGVNDVSEGK